MLRRRLASHLRRRDLRWSSEVPPQTPARWLVSRANSRQAPATGQIAQIAIAFSMDPFGVSGVGKKMAFGYPEQAARSLQSPTKSPTRLIEPWVTPQVSRRDPKVAKRDQSSLSLQAEVSPLSKPSVNISSTSSGPATSELSPPDSDGSVMNASGLPSPSTSAMSSPKNSGTSSGAPGPVAGRLRPLRTTINKMIVSKTASPAAIFDTNVSNGSEISFMNANPSQVSAACRRLCRRREALRCRSHGPLRTG